MNLVSTCISSTRLLLRRFSAWLLLLFLAAPSPAQTVFPPNDHFEHRIPLEGPDVDVWGTNVNATVEPGEPPPTSRVPELGHTVWWSWTAPADGAALLSVRGSSFPAYLRVFRGESLTDLVEVYPANSIPFPSGQLLGIEAEVGVTYVVLVGGYAQAYPSVSSGAIRLKVSIFQSPVNDDFANSIPITVLPAKTNGLTAHATTQPDEPIYGSGRVGSVWWSWTAPVDGTVTSTLQARPPEPQDATLPVSLESDLAVYTGVSLIQLGLVGRATGLDVWDTALAQVSWEAVAGTTYHLQVRGQFHWHAGYALNLAMNKPPSVSLVEPIELWDQPASEPLPVWAVANDPDGRVVQVEFLLRTIYDEVTTSVAADSTAPFQARFENLPPGMYQLLARAFDDGGSMGEAVGVRVSVRPVNDQFRDRILIHGAPVCATGAVLNATSNFLPPQEGGEVWWSWTAPASGLYRLRLKADRFGSAEATVFSGATLESLQEIGQTSQDASLSFQAEEGHTYPIGVNGASSQVVLHITPSAAPTLQIMYPTDGAVLAADEAWTLQITPQDPDGVLEEVRLELDDQPLATLFAPAYAWVNTGLIPPGFHYVRAVGVDSCGTCYASADVAFRIVSSRPPNDNFADRIRITDAPWRMESVVGDATLEPTEAAYGNRSLWWSWVAPSSGPCVLQGTSSAGGHLPVMVAFEGDTLETLAPIANFEPIGGQSSRLTWEATAGTEYQIAVYGSRERESVELEFIRTSPPTVTVTHPQPHAMVVAGDVVTLRAEAEDLDGSIAAVEFYLLGTRDTLIGTVTQPPYELDINSTNATFYVTYFSVLAIDDKGARSLAAGSDFHTFILPDRPENDNFQDRIPFTGAPASVTGTVGRASSEPGEPWIPNHPPTVWWVWTPSISGIHTIRASVDVNASPAVAVFTGSDLTELTRVTNHVFRGEHPGYTAQVTFLAEAGVPYQIAAGASGSAVLTLLVAPGWPPEVSLLSPTPGLEVVESSPVVIESAPTDDGTLAYVEFYAASRNRGRVTDPPFRLIVPSLPKDTTQARVYVRAVDEWGLDAWSEIVTVNQSPLPPGNDRYANRPNWAGPFHTFSGNFRAATSDANEPEVPGLIGARSLWWQWTAPLSGRALLSLRSGSVGLVVFAGTEVDNLVPVRTFSNLDTEFGLQLAFDAQGHTSYQLGLYETNGYDLDFDASLFLDARHLELIAPGDDANPAGRFWTTFDFPWVIERADDFSTWTPIATNTPLHTRIDFMDTNVSGGPVFYRARGRE